MSLVNVVSARAMSQWLPQPVRFGMRKLLYKGTAVSCPLCGNSVRGMKTYGGQAEVLTRRHVVGSMARPGDACPVCHGAARTRLMLLYLRDVLKAATTRPRVLHVAPEPGLYLWIKDNTKVDYLATDLDQHRYRHVKNFQASDLTRLVFEDNTFDVLICSHVLEHIPDDRKAMSEILRVLKPGGKAMLMVPLATDGAATDEDPSVKTPRERDERFGQWDHVRLYSKDDFVARLTEAGFFVSLFNGVDQFPEELTKLRLDPEENLIIAEKPLAALN